MKELPVSFDQLGLSDVDHVGAGADSDPEQDLFKRSGLALMFDERSRVGYSVGS